MGRSLAANLGECGEEHAVTMASCGWPEGHAGTRHAALVETALVTWDEDEWATLPPVPTKPAVGQSKLADPCTTLEDACP